MGAASLETELLWVGGPIAIQRTSTWSMSDITCEDIAGEHIACVFLMENITLMYKHYFDSFFYCFFISTVKNALIRPVLMQQIPGEL